MKCDWDDRGVCKRCQHKASRLPLARRCRGAGLGDMAAAALSAVGVTPARVEYWFGSCNCEARQEQLNQFGREWLGIGIDHP